MNDQRKKYLILPGCDDSNRGDQALIWMTAEIASNAGFCGQYYMVADKKKCMQSTERGIIQLDFVLPHPSTHFKKNDNIQYGKILLLKWALATILDVFKSVFLLNNFLRKMLIRFYSESVQNTINVFEQSEAVFVKGAGFLHSYGSIANTYANYYDLYHIKLALKMGKKVYFMPNSFGPFLSPGTGKMIKKVLSRCKYVSVRESISQDYLKERLQINAEKKPDLAFYLNSSSKLSLEQNRKLESVLRGEKNVAITVRPYRFPSSKNPEQKYEKYKLSICEIIKHLAAQGFHVVLIEHTHSENSHENDMNCIEDIQCMLGNTTSYSVYSDWSLDCAQLKYVYSKFDYIIGTRFHSVIFSLASRIPAIAITYGGNKGQGIMEDMGICEYVVSIDEISGDILTMLFKKMVDNKKEIQKMIDKYLGNLEPEKQALISQIARER